MRWTNIFGAAGVLILVSAFRLQDKFMFRNQAEREQFVKAQEPEA